MDLKEQVKKVFQDQAKPLRPGEVAKILGVESKDVSKVIKELKQAGELSSPKRCYYALNE